MENNCTLNYFIQANNNTPSKKQSMYIIYNVTQHDMQTSWTYNKACN